MPASPSKKPSKPSIFSALFKRLQERQDLILHVSLFAAVIFSMCVVVGRAAARVAGQLWRVPCAPLAPPVPSLPPLPSSPR